MKINGNAIKPGNVIEHGEKPVGRGEDRPRQAGQGRRFAQVELKNLLDGRKLNERFRSSDTVERVTLEQKEFQYLYEQGEMLVFMDVKNYEQIEFAQGFRRRRARPVPAGRHGGDAGVLRGPPDRHRAARDVVLEIVEADAVVRGQTASSSYKPAKASNGMRILIPPYMGTGERVLVSTETGEYMRRAD